MVVAVFLKDFSLGGGPRAAYYFCESMPKVKFIIFACDGAMHTQFMQLDNVEIVVLKKWDMFTFKTIKKIIINKQVEVLHFHHLLPITLYLMSNKNKNIPSIVTFHGLHIKKYLYRFNPLMKIARQLIKYVILKNVDRGIVLTERDKEFLNKIYNNKFSDKIYIVPNSINLKRDDYKNPKYFNKKYFNLLMVARFDFAKGNDILVRYFNAIFREVENLRMFFIGDEKVKELVESAHCSKAIFLPQTLEPYAYIKEADALIIPSRWEGLPMVALEALSLGTRVIASKQTNLDLLSNGNNILLFDLFNPNDLIQKIKECINISYKPVEFNFEKFSPQTIGSIMFQLYQEVIEKNE